MSRRSVKSPFKLLDTVWTDDELKEKIEDLKKDYSAAKRNAIAIGLLRLSMSVVSGMASFVKDSDDLVGETFENLIEILDGIAKEELCKHENYAGYITFSLRARLVRYTLENHVIRVPQSELLKDTASYPVVEATDYEAVVTENFDEQLFFEEVCVGLTESEITVLKLRLEDWSDSEIALQMGVSRQTVFRTRKGIGDRLHGVLQTNDSEVEETGTQLD